MKNITRPYRNELEAIGLSVESDGKIDIDRSLLTDAVTAADAARMLKVSSARVAQMCLNGKLTSWKEGTKRMVLRSSIEARLEECPKAGRPRKPQRQSKKALEV